MQVVDKHKLPFLGDVGNRLFPALPLPDQLKAYQTIGLRQRYGELIVTLNALNRRSIVPHWNHLRDCHTVLAIAGGQLKLNVIWTLLLASKLGPEKRVITDLSTDIMTAKRLIGAFRSLKTQSGVEDWYRETIDGISLFGK